MPWEEARVSNVCLCSLTNSVHWFPVTPTLNIYILALFSQVSIADIHDRSKRSSWSIFGRTSFLGHFGTAHAHVACVLVQHNGR